MATREEVDRILTVHTGKTGIHLDAVKRELSEAGVVIKVENVGIDLTYAYEVTGSISDTDLTIIVNAVEEAYKSAGHVATEPLVEEKNENKV